MHEDGLPGADRMDVTQQKVRRNPLEEERRRSFRSDIGRQPGHHAGRHGARLGIGAWRQTGIDDPVARREMRDTGSHIDHLAGRLQPWNRG